MLDSVNSIALTYHEQNRRGNRPTVARRCRSSTTVGGLMGPPRAPPPAHYNFAQHVAGDERRPRRQARVRGRRADAHLRRTRGRRRADGACAGVAVPQARGARARRAARHRRFPGRVPGRVACGRRAGAGQHAAHRRRLRVHAGAQPRAGARRVRRVAADVRTGDDPRGARGEARRRVASGSRAGRRRARVRRAAGRAAGGGACAPPRRSPTTSRSGSTRRARRDGPRAPCIRTATCTGPRRCTACR